mgnify:FL=1
MPKNRKGHKTRIVSPDKFSQFLNFVQTRVSLGEQAYIVVPAIEESENLDLMNLNNVLKRFCGFFPEQKIEGLHGKMDAAEKNDVFERFKNKEINILVSTSVIEVGINVLNATIIAVLNPERFGLSSLHQLRGRVGRGEKPGFCFLVCDKPLSVQAFQRLSVIENNTDGFIIAEEDLKIRGEGDLFGTNQSGTTTSRKVASIFEHSETLYCAIEDVEALIKQNDPLLTEMIQSYRDESLVFSTI